MGSVSGSSTGPLDSESFDPVPDLEIQSLEVRYWTPSQPYEVSGLGVYGIVLYSHNIWIVFVQLPCNLLFVVLVISTEYFSLV